MDTAAIQTLHIESIEAAYDKAPVVKGVSFIARAGELTILIGPNGCGKSTLLKTVARVLHPTSGRITINGQSGKSIQQMHTKELARHLAWLPQGPIAPEGLTVHELVSQGRFPYSSLLRQWSSEDSRAVQQAMSDTDLATLANRPLAALSGGQRQRVWIAMALAQNTQIIILDEPTTFLDLKVQVDVMSLLQKIAHQHQRILVVVLHDLNIATAFADTIIMMKDGQLMATGPPKATITPANLKAVFGLDAQIIQAPQSGRPVCIPIIH